MIGCSVSRVEDVSTMLRGVQGYILLGRSVVEIISADEFRRGKCPCRCMPSRPWLSLRCMLRSRETGSRGLGELIPPRGY